MTYTYGKIKCLKNKVRVKTLFIWTSNMGKSHTTLCPLCKIHTTLSLPSNSILSIKPSLLVSARKTPWTFPFLVYCKNMTSFFPVIPWYTAMGLTPLLQSLSILCYKLLFYLPQKTKLVLAMPCIAFFSLLSWLFRNNINISSCCFWPIHPKKDIKV